MDTIIFNTYTQLHHVKKKILQEQSSVVLQEYVNRSIIYRKEEIFEFLINKKQIKPDPHFIINCAHSRNSTLFKLFMNCHQQTGFSQEQLSISLYSSNLEIAKWIIENCPIDLERKPETYNNQRVIDIALTRSTSLEHAQYLINKGADINISKKEGLEYSVRDRNIDLIQFFLKQGAIVSKYVIYCARTFDIIKLLIEQGNADPTFVLLEGLYNMSLKEIKYLIGIGANPPLNIAELPGTDMDFDVTKYFIIREYKVQVQQIEIIQRACHQWVWKPPNGIMAKKSIASCKGL